jgi:hypothetical protein
MGRIVPAMLAAGLALLVSLVYPVVEAVGRVTRALSELAFGDRPASDEEGEAALDHDDPATTAEEQLAREGATRPSSLAASFFSPANPSGRSNDRT